MIPPKFAEFAKKFLQIAKKDLERSRFALNEKDYPEVVFHAQQAVEKAVKAMLETKLFYTTEHNVLPYFVKEFQKGWRKDFDKIVMALDFLHGGWALPRYPRMINKKIIMPEEEYDEKFAKKAIKLATVAVNITEAYLREKNVI